MSFDISITGHTGHRARCEQCGATGSCTYTSLGRLLCGSCQSAFSAGVVAAGMTGAPGVPDIGEAVVVEGFFRRLTARWRRT
jgi:hypothetical protein